MDFKKLGIILVCISIGLLGIEYISYVTQSAEEKSHLYAGNEEDNRLIYLALVTAVTSLALLITAYIKDDPSHS